MSMAALDPEFQNMTNSVESAGRLSGWSDATGEVPRENWPMMVRFGDINDPKTVEPVDPGAFGVKRILLETTSDYVTTGIGKRLEWIKKVNGSYLHGGFSSRGAPLGLTGLAFSTEVKK